jgi:hypothetical protein
MPDYAIEFEGHIDERKRPEGFPRSVFVREQYQGIETDQQLKELYNSRFLTIVKQPGFVVYLEDQIIDGTSLSFDQRVYIPWHMITHFHGNAKLMTPQLENIMPQEVTLSEKEKKLPIQ